MTDSNGNRVPSPTLFRYRWIRFVAIDGKIKCPSGHDLDIKAAWHDDDLVCAHTNGRGYSDCGRILWLIGGAMRLRGKPVLVVCEISREELLHLSSHATEDAWHAIRYLGLDLGHREDAA